MNLNMEHEIPGASPDSVDGKHICDRLFPYSVGSSAYTAPTRFANSGAIIGFASAFLDIFRVLDGLPEWFQNDWPGTDQAFFSLAYLTRAYNVTVDVCNDIVLVTLPSGEAYQESTRKDVWDLYAHGPLMSGYNTFYARNAPGTSPFASVWASKETDRVPPVLHNNGYFHRTRLKDVKDEDINPGTEAKIRRDGPCSSNLPSIENVLWGKKLPNARSCNRKLPWVEQCHAIYEKEILPCKLEDEILDLVHDKRASGLGFWIAFSPVQLYNRMSQEQHKDFAKASYAAVQAIGVDKWVGIISMLTERSNSLARLWTVLLCSTVAGLVLLIVAAMGFCSSDSHPCANGAGISNWMAMRIKLLSMRMLHRKKTNV